MTDKATVDAFLAARRIAVVGVSRNSRKFANLAFRQLKQCGYEVLAVNPKTEQAEGERCYGSLAALPGPVEAALLVVKPGETERVVRDASAAGVRLVWMQQGAGSAEAVRYCKENGIRVVSGECILMFAKPTGIHKFHRFVWKCLGKLPEERETGDRR